MSTPICSRCQKMYTAGSAPANCINCGGDVRVPGAAIKSQTTGAPKAQAPQVKPSPKAHPNGGDGPELRIPRSCSMESCLDIPENSVEYFSDVKQIVIRPITSGPLPNAQYFCLRHTSGIDVPPGWRLLKKFPNSNARVVPAHSSSARAVSSSNPSTGGDGGMTFIFGVIGFVIFVAVVIMIVNLFSGLDTGDTRPIKVPLKWRK